jgi:hypothetical protein
VPATPRTPRDRLREYCRLLADLVGWDRSVGDDAPRFGLMFRDRADALLAAAHGLAAHPHLSGDRELADRVAALDAAVARPVAEPRFTRDVVAAGHEVAERLEDLLDVAW